MLQKAAVFELEFHTDCCRHLEASQGRKEGGTGERERERVKRGQEISTERVNEDQPQGFYLTASKWWCPSDPLI